MEIARQKNMRLLYMKIKIIKGVKSEMKRLPFYLVDVFAEEKYAGNQLAVVRNSCGLSTAQMQRIANETHFSETAGSR